MKKLFLLLLIYSALPVYARAATAVLMLDTQKETINALEATITFPPSAHIQSVENGDSMILIWIEGPKLATSDRTVRFSGLTPGGFNGRHAVLAITGEFSESDVKNARIGGVAALRNDGKGTPASVVLSLVSGQSKTDTDTPTPFTITLGTDPELYDGAHVATFLAQDKGTGVDHYEYALTLFGFPEAADWQRGESPLVLRGTDLLKNIYVRAVDRAGNAEVSTVQGPYRNASIFILIMLCIIICICAPSFSKRFFSSL